MTMDTPRWLTVSGDPHNILYDTNSLHVARGGIQLVHSDRERPTLLHLLSRDAQALAPIEEFCAARREDVQLYAETGGLYIGGEEQRLELINARHMASKVSARDDLSSSARRIARLQADIFDLGARLGRSMERTDDVALERRLADGIARVMDDVGAYTWEHARMYTSPPSSADIHVLSTALACAHADRMLQLRSRDGWHVWANLNLQRLLSYSGVLAHVPHGYSFSDEQLELLAPAATRVA